MCYTSIAYRGARPSCIFGCRPLSRGTYDLGKSTTTFRLHCHYLPLCANNNFAHRFFASSTVSFVRHDLRYPYFLHVDSILLGPTSTGSSRTIVPSFPLTHLAYGFNIDQFNTDGGPHTGRPPESVAKNIKGTIKDPIHWK